jgi:Ca2+/Na+ antiporter
MLLLPVLVLLLFLSVLLLLLVLVLLLFISILLLLFRLSLLNLFRGLSLLLLVLLCVCGSYASEEKQQNSRADNSNWFHESYLHYVYFFLRPSLVTSGAVIVSGDCLQ